MSADLARSSTAWEGRLAHETDFLVRLPGKFGFASISARGECSIFTADGTLRWTGTLPVDEIAESGARVHAVRAGSISSHDYMLAVIDKGTYVFRLLGE
jgi:hypothetical protein